METHDDPAECQLHIWCTAQRKFKNKNELSPKEVDTLSKLKNWKWAKGTLKTFNQRYEELLLWQKTNGKMPSSSASNYAERTIGSWCDTKRTEWRRGTPTLTADHIERLEKIEGWYWKIDEFTRNYNDLVKWLKEYESWPIKQNNRRESRLIKWCEKMNKKLLSSKQIEQLEKIKDWKWIN